MIQYGPNKNKTFPSEKHVENFSYDGFGVSIQKGFSKWTITQFNGWTMDPGIGRFTCSDGQERLIPSCQLHPNYYKSLPKRPKLEPFKGNGVFFGEPSKS